MTENRKLALKSNRQERRLIIELRDLSAFFFPLTLFSIFNHLCRRIYSQSVNSRQDGPSSCEVLPLLQEQGALLMVLSGRIPKFFSLEMA